MRAVASLEQLTPFFLWSRTIGDAPSTSGQVSTSLEGGCTCREVRYRLESAPMFVHCCHCTWCQRETGSAFALNALIETDRVTVLEGQPELILTPTLSGAPQNICRCLTCKVALWSHYGMAVGGKVSFVRVGTLDGARNVQPDIHIFTSTKQPWLELGDDVPVLDEYYDRNDYWPADSLRRFEALEG